jgi:hypothetical protein
VAWALPDWTVQLIRGDPAPFGYWYRVHLSGLMPHSNVVLICRDSVDPGGFKTFTVQIAAAGAATVEQACYSGDGPEHWVTADGRESNRVTW